MTTVRIPLFGQRLSRVESSANTTKDQRFINCSFEIIQNPLTNEPKVFVSKRAGLVLNSTIASTATPRAIYIWRGSQFVVIGNTVYKDGVAMTPTLATTTGRVGFTEATLATTPVLFFCDGTDGYYMTTSYTITKVIDVDFPTPHIPTPVYMDGYVFIVKSTTNEIYNSDLENPTSWMATNFIQAEMYPDGIVALSRQNNQLVAFGSNTIEFFFDAGNPVGSPLSRSDQLVQQQGILFRDTLDQAEAKFCWVSFSDAGGRCVMMMEGFSTKQISTPVINRALLSAPDTSVGQMIRSSEGRLLYILSISDTTFVYDFELNFWYEWQNPGGSAFLGVWFTTSSDGQIYCINNVSGASTKIYRLSNTAYQDDSVNFTMFIRTVKWDGGGTLFKQFKRMELVGDINSTYSGTTLTIDVTDDDYETYKLARTWDISKRMYGWAFGQGRRRAFRIQFTGNAPLRLEALEVELDEGNL